MNMVLTVVIAYLVVNLMASIFELIRDRKEYYSHIKKKIDDRIEIYGSDGINYERTLKVGYAAGVITTLVIDMLFWAPLKLLASIVTR